MNDLEERMSRFREEMKPLLCLLANGEYPPDVAPDKKRTLRRQRSIHKIRMNKLYRKRSNKWVQVLMTAEDVRKVIDSIQAECGRHGLLSMRTRVSENYFWPRFLKDISEIVYAALQSTSECKKSVQSVPPPPAKKDPVNESIRDLPTNLETMMREELLHLCLKMRHKLDRAMCKIERLKKKLEKSGTHQKDQEATDEELEDMMADRGDTNFQLNLMSSRIQYLTDKLAASEVEVRRLRRLNKVDTEEGNQKETYDQEPHYYCSAIENRIAQLEKSQDERKEASSTDKEASVKEVESQDQSKESDTSERGKRQKSKKTQKVQKKKSAKDKEDSGDGKDKVPILSQKQGRRTSKSSSPQKRPKNVPKIPKKKTLPSAKSENEYCRQYKNTKDRSKGIQRSYPIQPTIIQRKITRAEPPPKKIPKIDVTESTVVYKDENSDAWKEFGLASPVLACMTSRNKNPQAKKPWIPPNIPTSSVTSILGLSGSGGGDDTECSSEECDEDPATLLASGKTGALMKLLQKYRKNKKVPSDLLNNPVPSSSRSPHRKNRNLANIGPENSATAPKRSLRLQEPAVIQIEGVTYKSVLDDLDEVDLLKHILSNSNCHRKENFCRLVYQYCLVHRISRPPEWDREEAADMEWLEDFIRRHKYTFVDEVKEKPKSKKRKVDDSKVILMPKGEIPNNMVYFVSPLYFDGNTIHELYNYGNGMLYTVPTSGDVESSSDAQNPKNSEPPEILSGDRVPPSTENPESSVPPEILTGNRVPSGIEGNGNSSSVPPEILNAENSIPPSTENPKSPVQLGNLTIHRVPPGNQNPDSSAPSGSQKYGSTSPPDTHNSDRSQTEDDADIILLDSDSEEDETMMGVEESVVSSDFHDIGNMVECEIEEYESTVGGDHTYAAVPKERLAVHT